MPKNNTARHLYVVSDREAPQAAFPPQSADKRPSGIGLMAAVLLSLALWVGLISAGMVVARALAT